MFRNYQCWELQAFKSACRSICSNIKQLVYTQKSKLLIQIQYSTISMSVYFRHSAFLKLKIIQLSNINQQRYASELMTIKEQSEIMQKLNQFKVHKIGDLMKRICKVAITTTSIMRSNFVSSA